MEVPTSKRERDRVPGWAQGQPQLKKITPPQRTYLLDLIEKKQVADPEGKIELIVKILRISEDPEEFGMSREKASELIEFFKSKPDKPRAHPAQESLKSEIPFVPAGRYAVNNAEGILRFYSVDRPTEGRWRGYVFLSVWASDEQHPIKNPETRNAILAEIAKDPKAAAEKFGQELGKCGICARTLTDPESRRIGIGPVCREKSGWY
jgi:hypothetical protein